MAHRPVEAGESCRKVSERMWRTEGPAAVTKRAGCGVRFAAVTLAAVRTAGWVCWSRRHGSRHAERVREGGGDLGHRGGEDGRGNRHALVTEEEKGPGWLPVADLQPEHAGPTGTAAGGKPPVRRRVQDGPPGKCRSKSDFKPKERPGGPQSE